MANTNKSVIHDFNVYEDEFHKHQNQLKIKSVGWNGREIEIIPLYQLMKFGIIPNLDLMNLKPFDIIRFEENRAFDSYLIVPLKVKNKFEVKMENMDEKLKKFLLGYGIIEFEFDCSGETACIPPEGIEAIEKHDIHYFDNIIEMEDTEGIIVDYMYIKDNFDKFENSVDIIGDPFEFDKIAFIWITNQYKLTLNDASDEQSDKMKNCKIIIPMMEIKDQMNAVQLIYSIMKNLPESRLDPYPHSFDLYENNVTNEMNETNVNNKAKNKVKLPNFKNMKKDELIKLLTEKCSKIDELETSLFHTKNELNKTTQLYKKVKADNHENERDARYLNHNVSKGVDNMRQLMNKLENELNKIKPEFC